MNTMSLDQSRSRHPVIGAAKGLWAAHSALVPSIASRLLSKNRPQHQVKPCSRHPTASMRSAVYPLLHLQHPLRLKATSLSQPIFPSLPHLPNPARLLHPQQEQGRNLALITQSPLAHLVGLTNTSRSKNSSHERLTALHRP